MDNRAPNLDAKGAPEPSKIDEEGLYETIKEWVTADLDWSNAWRVQAKKELAFVPGPGQWAPEDVQRLQDEERPVVTFNKTLKFIRSICGIEANNKQETIFLPDEFTNAGEVKANEVLTSASEWMSRGCQAGRAQSRAFRDATIIGMGWTEGVIEYDEDPQGKYIETRCHPLEMGWDKDAREANLIDSKRRWRVRSMSLADARKLFPGVTDDPNLLDSDLDASWASDVSNPKDPNPKTQEQKELREDNRVSHDPKRKVHIVQIQWWEYEAYIRTIDPTTGGQIDISEEQYGQLNAQYGAYLQEGALPSAKLRRKVFKQAFVGGKLLKVGPCPREDGFTFNCITWEPDDNEGTWFGMGRVLWDPATWSNKFFAQIMHIINSTAKGGVLIEKDAIDGDAGLFLKNYAKPNAMSVVAPGAIAKGKIMAKPGAAITGGVMQLLEITDRMLSDVTGMNLELMGLADRQQPGILEAQRKQAAMTILATLFDSYTAFRADVGRMRLYFIQNYLADGRLIRVHGEDGIQAMPLIKDKTLGRYDVVIDDAPSSPNGKEQAWQGLQMLLPAVQHMLTPEVVAVLLDYVPNLNSKLVESLKQIALRPNPQAEEAAALETEGKKAVTEKDKTQAVLNLAKAGETQAKAEATRTEGLLSMFGIGPKAPRTPSDEPAFGPRADGPRQIPPLRELGVEDIEQIARPGPGIIPPGGLGGIS